MMLFKLWQNALLEQVPFWKFIYVIFRKPYLIPGVAVKSILILKAICSELVAI